jgi:ketopantoate reductase
MDKINFDHSQQTICGTFGVTQERYYEIFEAVKSAYFEASDIGQTIEHAINALDPVSPADLVLITIKWYDVHKQVKNIKENMDGLLKAMLN